MTSKEKKANPQQHDFTKSDLLQRFKANPLIFIGTIVVLIIVIVAFVFVPAIVPSAGGLGMDLSFGSYNKIPITYVPGNYFSQVRDMLVRDYQRYGVADNQIWRMAFEEAVVHTGILQEMKQTDYTVPAQVVDRRVALLPQFQENGVFSVARYRALDRGTRMSLWRQVQESIIEEYYRADITDLRMSSKEAPFVGAMGSTKRSFDMAAFPIRSYPDAEINAYAADHKDLFMVTHLSRITITTNEREARQIHASVQEGTSTFEDAARTHSKDTYAEKGGDMGIRMAYEFIAEVPDAAERESLMKLVKGELSALVKVSNGWAFFRAEDAPRQADTGDAALVEKIRSYIMTFERGRVEDFFLNQAEQFIAEVQEYGFDEVLSQREIEKRSFGPLPINYGNTQLFSAVTSSSVSEISGAGYNESFWQTAFSTPLLTPSSPLVIGDNVVVLYPTEETAEDAINTGYMETAYSSYWLNSFINQNIRAYFLNNEKLDDRFWESYFKYVQTAN